MATQKRRLPANKSYRCSVCGREKKREELTVKKVNFQTMGQGARIIRSRVLGWLCKSCLSNDPVWNQQDLKGARFDLKRDDDGT